MPRDLKRLADGTVDASADFGNAFDDVLDEMHSQDGGNAGAGVKTVDAERVKRWEANFLEGLKTEVNSQLVASGMWVMRAHLDATDGEAYLVHLEDQAQRPFEVRVTVDSMALAANKYGEDAGREIIAGVVREALAARQRWFARMQ